MRRTLTIALLLALLSAGAAFAETERGQARVTPWSGYWWSLTRGELALGYDGRPAPLEKYDMAAGNAEPLATQWYLDNEYKPDGESWYGYCHAWSAASIMEAEPQAVEQGEVAFRVGDGKGLVTACHSADAANFWGDRFGDNHGDEDPQDIYPCLLWQLLRTHIGANKLPLVMDMKANAEVWNYPVYAYEVQYEPMRGRQYRCHLTLRGVDDMVRPDFEGQQATVWEYDFAVELQDGNLVLGSGKWTGASRQDHPDFAWFPTMRRTNNPHLKYAAVTEMLRLPEGPVMVELPPPGEPPPPVEPPAVELPPQGEALQTVQNETQPFEVKVWVDRKGEPPTYQIGETVTVYFEVSRACYVKVLDLGTSGKLTQIFPNKFHTDDRVEPGKTYSIPASGDPFQYRLGEPVGTEMLKLIATTKPIEEPGKPPKPPAAQQQPFQSIQQPTQQYAKGLKDMLMEELEQDEWADAWCVFRVIAK